MLELVWQDARIISTALHHSSQAASSPRRTPHLQMDGAEQGGCRHSPGGCKQQVSRRRVWLPGLSGNH